MFSNKDLLYLLLGLCLLPLSGYAQLDSLENALIAMPRDSVKVELLFDLAKKMRAKGNFNKSKEFQSRACKLSTEVDYAKGNVLCLNDQGVRERTQGNYFLAEEKHKAALKIARASGDQYQVSVTLNLLGTVYRRLDNIENALECHLEALEIDKLRRNQKGIAVSLNSIGNIYLTRGDYNKALETFEECIKIETRLNNKLGVAINLNNIGYIYNVRGDYLTALNYYEKSLAANQEIGSKKGLAICFNDIGQIKQKLGAGEEALKYFAKALDINKGLGYKQYAVENYINIGDVHFEKKRYELALDKYLIGLNIAREISTLAQVSQCLNNISKVHEKTGNLPEALNSYKESIRYQDSLSNRESEKTTSQLLARYEMKNKELQIQELESLKEIQAAKIERRRVTIIALIISIVLALALLAVLYKNYRRKKSTNSLLLEQKNEIEKQKQKIENKNKALESKNQDLIDLNLEKNNVLGIIAHDLRSPMNHIIGLTSIMSYRKETLNADQLQSLEMISDTSARMREMINRILDINTMDAKEITLELEEVNVSGLLQKAIKEFLDPANNKNIQLNTDIAQNLTAELDKNYTLQIFENLIANALKFSPKNKNIFIRLMKNGNCIRVEIEDQGPGIKESEQHRLFEKFQILSAKPTGGEKSTGLGLYIVKTFVEAMGGKVWCESEAGKGANFIVEFPT
ncbi:tetratricopeptide repeat-containing sensor histidine kinase [Fulvivirgaceae bacterium BMA12]|uniref:histidine kinase n=1 Tax=Agaribacillus aureus TaxID=3051825 RepID=A0ABT8LHU6_9BACT|nr:tetratricopeptide repeat-containing sensor histidine kinase [Fulvivirgaceae bacterium BMA12]